MKKKLKINHIVVNIGAKFGSEFQQEVALDSLRGLVQSWVIFYSDRHKKNKITAEISYPGEIKYWPESSSRTAEGAK